MNSRVPGGPGRIAPERLSTLRRVATIESATSSTRIEGTLMNPQFRVIVIGGTGQVGSAVVQALLAESVCREVVMVTRKPVVIADPGRIRNVVMDTGAADFEMRVADLAREVAAGGDRMSAVSCVGVGSGSLQWTEVQLKQLEIGVVGAFARGVRQAGVAQFCLLSAV